MDSNELEFKKSVVRADNIRTVVGLFSHIATLIVVYLCIDKAMEMLMAVSGNSPRSIEALAKLVDSLKLSQVTGSIVAIMGVSYGLYERKGKKRAIAKVADLRQQVEADDPYNKSSGLTVTGDTPRRRVK